MKLLSAYIEAFGGIAKRQYRFDEGLSEILADNGTGKSTLAAFIKAMLYGLSGARHTKELERNEFYLYQPWEGGRFGGTLTLACRFGEFRIERYFDTKSKPEGTLTVVDLATGLACDTLGTVPGYTLLSVDGESFLLTAYLSSLGITAGKSADISAKLCGVDGESWDMNKYTQAMKLLKKKRDEIRVERHSPKPHALTRAEARRDELEAALREARTAAEKAAEADALIAERTELLKKTQEALRLANTMLQARREQQAAEKERASQREALSAEVAEWERELGDRRAAFPAEAPSEAVVDGIAAIFADRHRLEVRVAGHVTPPALPTHEEIAAAEAALARKQAAEARLAATPRPTEGSERRGDTAWLLPALTGLLAVAGIVLFFLLPVLGAILLGGGVISAIFAFLLFRRAKAATEEARQTADAYHEAEESLRREEEECRAVFARASIPLTDATGLAALRERRTRADGDAAAQESERRSLDALNAEITERLAAYGIPDGATALATLRERSRALRDAERGLEGARARLEKAPLPRAIEGEDATAEIAENAAGLQAEADSLLSTLAAARQEAERYRATADRQDALADELAEAEEKCASLTHRADVLTDALDYLERARSLLDTKCFGGLRERLARYNERLLAARGITMRLDTELGLSFSESGEDGIAHDLCYYSTGLRAIADVCLRLAMTDELFVEEPPPLVLDDPFMALDGDNLAMARDLLTELAKERQILYLTCHPSRSLQQ